MIKATNGNGWLVKFSMAGLFAITVGTTGAFASWIMKEQSMCHVTQMDHGERLARLEAVQAGIGETLARLDVTMVRLLER